MVPSEPRHIGVTIGLRTHAYDPAQDWERFDGVLPRRVLAFAIDVAVVLAPIVLAYVIVFLFALVTLGLGWILHFLLYPGAIVWILVYYGATLGGPAAATLGMRLMEIEMRTWYGAPCHAVLGAAHAVAFYVSVSTLTPLVLAIGFLNTRHRLLHDLVLGVVVINNARRAASLRALRVI
jgi:uncharacterized RDD family membrane protein YckC